LPRFGELSPNKFLDFLQHIRFLTKSSIIFNESSENTENALIDTIDFLASLVWLKSVIEERPGNFQFRISISRDILIYLPFLINSLEIEN
jgi:hypothetical protein